MHAVDTNVLLRLLTGDDARQGARAEHFIRSASGGWVSHLVLAEAVWVLDSVYGRTREQLAAAIEQLLNHTLLVFQEPSVVAAALAQFNEHKSVGFSDCLVLEIARKAGHLPLSTFDKKLGGLEGAHRV